MALRVFTTARAALETARGTTTTPTRLIYGDEFVHEQNVETIRPEELRNSYAGFFAASAGRETNRITIRSRATYDDMPWYGACFLKGGVSPTGGGDPYTWTYLPTLTSDDLKTIEFQLGYSDTIGASAPGIKLNYCLGESLNMHWEKSEDAGITMEATFLAATAATQITAFTGSLSDRTVTYASTNNTTIYSDPGGTIGATADSYIIAVDWTLNLNPVPLYTLDATTAAKAIYRPQHRTWTATITRQFFNDTFWDDFIDKTVQKLRIKTSSGASRNIQLDLYGVYTARSWSEVDGIITEELTLEPVYDATSTSDHNMVILCDEATVT